MKYWWCDAVVRGAVVTAGRWFVLVVLLVAVLVPALPAAGAPVPAPAGVVPLGATAAPLAQDSRQPIFEETFADNRAGWPEAESRFFAEDGYHIIGESREPPSLFSVQPRLTPRAADIAMEAQFQKLDGPNPRTFGVAFRSTTTPRRVYRLLITGNGTFTLDRVTESGTQPLIPFARSGWLLPGNQANAIGLVARGTSLSVFLNGRLAGWVQDDGVSEAGAIQLLAGSDVHVVVRALRAWEPIEADAAPPAPNWRSILFQDSFADDRQGWATSETRWVDQDGYHLRNEPRDTRAVFTTSPVHWPVAGDIGLEAELRKLEGPDDRPFGIAVRVNGSGQPARGYRLYINAEGSFGLFHQTAEGTTALVPYQRSPVLATGNASNTVRLVVRGNVLSVFLNGRGVARLQDDGIAEAGGIQLLTFDGQHVLVRRLVAWVPLAQDAEPPEPGRYYNHERGYSLVLPATWQATPVPPGSPARLVQVAVGPRPAPTAPTAPAALVVAESLPLGMSLETYFQAGVRNLAARPDYQNAEQGTAMLGGTEARLHVYSVSTGEYRLTLLAYVATFGGRGYSLTLTDESSAFAGRRAQLEEIARSFRLE